MSIFRGDAGRAAEIEARGTAFRMQTNLKATPGAQGTLFQGGKPTNEHRWPRGYSPTRMASVSTAFGPRRLSVAAPPDLEHDQPHPYFNPASATHTERLVLEPLARSTHDPSTFSSLRGIHLALDPSIPTRRGEAAHYSGYNARIQINRRPWTSGSERTNLARADATLMHEVGHHVDLQQRADEIVSSAHAHPAGADAGWEAQKGTLEHQADASMIEHFRNDPRNQRRTKFDVRKETYGGLGVAHLAGPGYTDPGVSHAPLQEQQFGTHPEQGVLF